MPQFFMLIRDRESGLLSPVSVTGATSPEAARRMVETATHAVVGFRDDYRLAAQEAAQLNAANGFTDPGCATCG